MKNIFVIIYFQIFFSAQNIIEKQNFLHNPNDYLIFDKPLVKSIIGSAEQEFTKYFENSEFLNQQEKQYLGLNKSFKCFILSNLYANFRYLFVADDNTLNFFVMNSLNNSIDKTKTFNLQDLIDTPGADYILQNIHYYKDNFLVIDIIINEQQNIILLEFDINSSGEITQKSLFNIYQKEQKNGSQSLIKQDFLFIYSQELNPTVIKLNLQDQKFEEYSKQFEGYKIIQGQFSNTSDNLYFLNDENIYLFNFKEVNKINIDDKIKYYTIDEKDNIYFTNSENKFQKYKKDIKDITELFLMNQTILSCQFFMDQKLQDFFYCYNNDTHFFYNLNEGEIQNISKHRNLQIIKDPQIQRYFFLYTDDQKLYLSIQFINNIHYKIKITSNNNYCPLQIQDCSFTKLEFDNYLAYIYTVDSKDKYILLKKQNIQITYDKFSFEYHYLHLKDFLFGFVEDFNLVVLKKQTSFEIDQQKYLQINIGKKYNNFYNKFICSQNYIVYASVIYTGYFKSNFYLFLKYYNINNQYTFQENRTYLTSQIQKIVTLNIFQNDVYIIYQNNNRFYFCSFLYYEYDSCKQNDIFSDEFFQSDEINFFQDRNQSKNLVFTFWKQVEDKIIFFEFSTEDVIQFKTRFYTYYFKSKIIDINSINIYNNTILCFQDNDNLYVVDDISKKNLIVEQKLNKKFFINKQYLIIIDSTQKQVTYRDWVNLESVSKKINFADSFEFLNNKNPVQFIGQFIVVKITKNDGQQYLASIDLSDKNPYFSFQYMSYSNKFKKFDYGCTSDVCMFFLFSEEIDKDCVYIINGSYWLTYKLGLKDFDSQEYQNIWNQEIVYQYGLQFNRNSYYKFSDRLNVQIAGSFIITNTRKGRMLQINSGYKADTKLLEYFKGNVFSISLGIDQQQDLQQWSIKQTEEKGYSIENKILNIQFDFLPFLFIPTRINQQLLAYRQSKILSVYNSIIEEDKYFILREDGMLVDISLQKKQDWINQTYNLKIISKDQEKLVGIKNCEKLNIFGQVIFLECFADLYWGDFTIEKEDTITLQSYDLTNKTKYDGNIVKMVENVMILLEKVDNIKRLKLFKLEGQIFKDIGLFELDDKFFKDKLSIEILFPQQDNIIIAVVSGQNLIFYLLKNFQLVYKSDPLLAENKWINFKKNQNETEIICLQQDIAVVYKFEIINNYLYFKPTEQITLELITNRDYLDYFYDNGFLFVLSFEHFQKSASISVQNYKGQIISYQDYESSELEKIFFLRYNKEDKINSLFVSSSINFFNQIFINWDYIIRNSSKEGIQENKMFKISAQNPYYTNNLEIFVFNQYLQEGFNLMIYYFERYTVEIYNTQKNQRYQLIYFIQLKYNNTMELHYWDIKGRPEPIRLMLAHLKMEYKEVAPENYQEWQKEKQKQVEEGVLFPNLPYLKDGGEILTETNAIAVYVVRKAKNDELLGKDADKVLYAQINGVLQDFFNKFKDILYRDGYEQTIESSQDFFKQKLSQLEKFVSGKDYLLPYLTYLDFQFYVLMNLYKQISTHSKLVNHLNESPNLTKVLNNVEQLDGVKQYLNEDARAKRTFVPPFIVKCPKEFIM